MAINLTQFGEQIFHPLTNVIVIFFSVFIALFTERLMKEFEDAQRLGIPNPENKLSINIFNFIIRFLISFIIVFWILYIIIVIISIGAILI